METSRPRSSLCPPHISNVSVRRVFIVLGTLPPGFTESSDGINTPESRLSRGLPAGLLRVSLPDAPASVTLPVENFLSACGLAASPLALLRPDICTPALEGHPRPRWSPLLTPLLPTVSSCSVAGISAGEGAGSVWEGPEVSLPVQDQALPSGRQRGLSGSMSAQRHLLRALPRVIGVCELL